MSKLSEILNLLDKAKSTLNRFENIGSDAVSEKVESLKLIIEEQRRDYDFLLHIYNRMRATEGLLLTASFGIIGYLYYKYPATSKASIADRLSIPPEDYGKVIYILAAAFFIYGVFKLMLNVFGRNPWETAHETLDTRNVSNHLVTLKHYSDRYDACYEFNSEVYFKRKKELGFLFYCILISATILVVIKSLK